MNQEYAGSSQWCASWRQWLDTGGAAGTEPPQEVKRLYEIVVARKATIPYSAADLALVDELFQLHYDNVWILPMIENVLRPTIFNADFGNIANRRHPDGRLPRGRAILLPHGAIANCFNSGGVAALMAGQRLRLLPRVAMRGAGS